MQAGIPPQTLTRWKSPVKVADTSDARVKWFNFNELKPKYQQMITNTLGKNSNPEPVEPEPINRSKKDWELAQAKWNIVNNYRKAAISSTGSKVKAKQDFIDAVCAGYLLQKEYETVGRKLSFKTVERWDLTMREGRNNMDDLFPKLRESSTEIELTAIHKEVLKRCYLQKNAPKIAEAIRSAEKIWRATNMDVPKEPKCRRFLVELEHNDAALCAMIRHGLKAMKDGLSPYIDRDPESIEFLDVLVADGHVMNFQVINPATGRLARPTLIGWIDMRTWMVMGWELMLTENTMSVASSLRQACINAGLICGVDGAVLPRVVYLDNGKSFKNKFFNAEIDLENQLGGLFERLKPYGLEDVTYAIPYNSRTKSIERMWGCMGEVERQVPAYCGTNINTKPANMHRNEKLAKAAYNAYLTTNGHLTLEQGYLIVSDWIMDYNKRQSQGKYLNGSSPLQLVTRQIQVIDFEPRILPGRQLDFMMMHTKVARLQRNGFNVNGVWYYNPKFIHIAKDATEYLVKYDILRPEKVLIYNEDGTFFCDAGKLIGQGVHAMAKLGSEADRNHLAAAMDEQNGLIKDVENKARAEMGMKPRVAREQKALPEPELVLVEKNDDNWITTGDGRRIQLRYF